MGRGCRGRARERRIQTRDTLVGRRALSLRRACVCHRAMARKPRHVHDTMRLGAAGRGRRRPQYHHDDALSDAVCFGACLAPSLHRRLSPSRLPGNHEFASSARCALPTVTPPACTPCLRRSGAVLANVAESGRVAASTHEFGQTRAEREGGSEPGRSFEMNTHPFHARRNSVRALAPGHRLICRLICTVLSVSRPTRTRLVILAYLGIGAHLGKRSVHSANQNRKKEVY